MAKKVIHAATRVIESKFGIDRELHRIACDDGTTYVFAKPLESPRWQSLARYGRDGGRSANPSRLPASVEAHMDGHTCSGPHGIDGDDYWV